MGKTELQQDQLGPTEQLIVAYVEQWQRCWPQAHKYTPAEQAMIRSYLYLVVYHRYVERRRKKLQFTKRELKLAIKKATQVVKETNRPDRDNAVTGQICDVFIHEWMKEWDRRREYSGKELMLIRSRLYSNAMDRFHRSGYTEVSFSEKELQGAMEFVVTRREADDRVRRDDERDERVRKGRKGLGALAATSCPVGSLRN